MAPAGGPGSGSTCLLLPAYNEEAALRSLLGRLPALAARCPLGVLVVNDGSSDGTGAVAEEAASRLPVECIEHPCNLGLGAAMRTGLDAVLEPERGLRVVVAMDADDTHPPELIPRMLEAIDSGADVVIASRFVPGGEVRGVSPLRQLTSWGAGVMARLLLPVRGVSDYTCGYRAYTTAILRRARELHGGRLVEEQGFAVTLELLTRVAAAGARFAEVPLELAYDRKQGASKMRVLRTSLATLRVLWRARRARRS